MQTPSVIPAEAGIQPFPPSMLRSERPGSIRSRGRIPAFAHLVQRLLLALAVFAVVVALTVPASAAETINSFSSRIVLLADGSVDVTEFIEVNAEGDRIRRGIYRDIPTVLINEDNSRLRSTLDVLSVERDGRAEPYALESLGTNATRIRIGDAEMFLSRGAHRYIIHYTMTRMARQFADSAGRRHRAPPRGRSDRRPRRLHRPGRLHRAGRHRHPAVRRHGDLPRQSRAGPGRRHDRGRVIPEGHPRRADRLPAHRLVAVRPP